MKDSKVALFIFVVILLSSLVSAVDDFTIGAITPLTKAEYQDGIAKMKVLITSNNNICDQTCDWSTKDDNGQFSLPDEKNYQLSFNSRAILSQGIVTDTLSITCDESALLCTGSPETKSQIFSHDYPYLGDNQCLTNNNKEDCTKSLSDCPCTLTPGSSCINDKGDQNRILDVRKCATWCGNGIKELTYEACSSCPIDVGKCDLTSCILGSECEGGFCVHEVCWNKLYREGDNFCDINQENCKNSNDCACKNNELCSNIGICEKSETSKEEITEAVKSGVQETLEVSKSRQKNVTIGAIILIVLIIIIYMIYKFMKGNKTISKNENKKEKFDKKARIAELKKTIKEHKAKIKEHKKRLIKEGKKK